MHVSDANPIQIGNLDANPKCLTNGSVDYFRKQNIIVDELYKTEFEDDRSLCSSDRLPILGTIECKYAKEVKIKKKRAKRKEKENRKNIFPSSIRT